MILRVKTGVKADRLFNEFLPCPAELHEYCSPEWEGQRATEFIEKYGAPDWYSWQCKNWGIKWDVDARIINEEVDLIELFFDSAWGPPIAFFEYMVKQGFEVEAYYHEQGMQFAGTFTNSEGDNSVDYSGWTADQVREQITELDERFCISEQIEEYEREQAEYEDEDGDDEENLEIDLNKHGIDPEGEYEG
jgi:hypothetical protein